MEDTEANDPTTETLSQQYQTVKTKTTMSPVQQFGDLSFLDEPIGDFEGTTGNSTVETLLAKAEHFYKKALGEEEVSADKGEMVDSRDHDLHVAYQRVLHEGSQSAYEQLQAEIDHRQFIDQLFATHFVDYNGAPEIPQNWDCYRMMVQSYEDSCGRFSAYSLKYTRKLANMCDVQPEKVEKTLEMVKEFCNDQ